MIYQIIIKIVMFLLQKILFVPPEKYIQEAYEFEAYEFYNHSPFQNWWRLSFQF